jgi:AcrR family transcriptional regulator
LTTEPLDDKIFDSEYLTARFIIMPKVIPGLKENILKCADEILSRGEFDKFSIRGIAKECGIAIGTLYNYYSSKDDILKATIESHMQKMLDDIDKKCAEAKSIADGICYICEGVRAFSEKHPETWVTSVLGGYDQAMVSEWKNMLRPAVVQKFTSLCERFEQAYDSELLPAIAEILIALGVQCQIDISISTRLLHQAASKLDKLSKKTDAWI